MQNKDISLTSKSLYRSKYICIKAYNYRGRTNGLLQGPTADAVSVNP